jgi:hypothetical protein
MAAPTPVVPASSSTAMAPAALAATLHRNGGPLLQRPLGW